MKLSIGVVALNEKDYLPNLLSDIKKQEYQHELIEVVLVDGGSGDGTREIMNEFANSNHDFYNVQVLDNQKKIQAAGWNVVITHATGDVISRIDAHAKLPADFSVNVMKNIENGENVVGGVRPCLLENETNWGKTLLAVENSLFGSGISSSRHSQEKKYVKTMFHASYRREVFERVGLFNEELLRTEDNEMHYRIREAGYNLLYDPQIVSYQYARNSFSKMIKQKYGNGYWVGYTLGVCPGCISIYHLVPVAFVLAILITSVIWRMGSSVMALLMWGLYIAFTLINTVLASIQYGFNVAMLVMPFLFLVLHVSYGVGTLHGIIKLLGYKITTRKSSGVMSSEK